MIIRRKHTANFSAISNVLFDDDRLQADEIGIIGYLMTRPHDWEVRRPQLAKRFKYGREAIKRVMWNGMRLGYIVAQKTRLGNGRIFTIYEVRDVPGPELSDEQIKAALSLGSSDAEDHADEGEETEHANHPPPTGDPATGHPGVGQPATGNPYVAPKEGATKDRFTKDESTKCARAFVEVRPKWPNDNVLSEYAAEQAFVALTAELQSACISGIAPYLDDCRANSRKVCDLTTYIKERRWERFAPKPPGTLTTSLVQPGTPQWFRWREYKIARREPVTFMDQQGRNGNAMTFASEWPPGLPKTGADPPKDQSSAA